MHARTHRHVHVRVHAHTSTRGNEADKRGAFIAYDPSPPAHMLKKLRLFTRFPRCEPGVRDCPRRSWEKKRRTRSSHPRDLRRKVSLAFVYIFVFICTHQHGCRSRSSASPARLRDPNRIETWSLRTYKRQTDLCQYILRCKVLELILSALGSTGNINTVDIKRRHA